MSIFFIGERVVHPVPPTPPTPEQVDDAIARCAAKEDPHLISAATTIPLDLIWHFIREARRIESLLIPLVADGTITTKTAAVQFVADNAEAPFPAAKFVDTMVSHCTPATVAGFLQACKDEMGTT